MILLILFAFLAGIFTVLSPCILPVLPAILAAGTFQGRWRPLGIILGLVLSFTFFTLALTTLVHATGVSPDILRYIAITVLILFGFVMIFPRLSDKFAEWTGPIANIIQVKQSSGFSSGFVFGMALGLLWTPCAGPILASITTLVATQSVSWLVILMTLAYSLGAAFPMFLIAYSGSKVIQSSRFLMQHTEGIRKLFGSLMIAAAIAIAFHWDMNLQQKIATLIPTVLIEDNALVKEKLNELYAYKETDMNLHGPAPELVGIVNWINSKPLSIDQLQGKVVLIDFWTYSCINCLRTLPYLKKWDEKYRDKGLVIIGVHTPEFEFEKDPGNVAQAVEKLGIKYPVAQDNDYKTWKAYQNLYWPAHYLIDPQGRISMIHFGEGAYGETENAIRELLGLKPLLFEEQIKSQRPISPETYLGLKRGNSYAQTVQPYKVEDYTYSKSLKINQVGLKGSWLMETERITSEGDHSFLDYNFIATHVYLVMSGSSAQSVQVFLDGKLAEEFKVDGARKYDIVTTTYGPHELSIKVPKGISAYAFTFGDE